MSESYVAFKVPAAGGSVAVSSGAQNQTALALYSIEAFPVPSYSQPVEIAYSGYPQNPLEIPAGYEGQIILVAVFIYAPAPVSFEITVPNDEPPVIDTTYQVRTSIAGGALSAAPSVTIVDRTP